MDRFTKIPGNKAVTYLHDEMLEASSKMVVNERKQGDGNDLQKMTVAERAIYDAITEVEKVGAHVILTETVCLLLDAKRKLSDYLDGKR